jgi:hypothetical protein
MTAQALPSNPGLITGTAWAHHAFAGATDTFETLHSGLTVGLVVTHRDELHTCRKGELISAVLAGNPHDFDFIPVVDDSPDGPHVVGLFHAADVRTRGIAEGSISSVYLPITEKYLIGADASILEFIIRADVHPCRLVLFGSQINGLVTLSDLQRLPVRATLFALITGFEIIMIDLIKAKVPDESRWMSMLEPPRARDVKRQIARARTQDCLVDALLHTNFSDKTAIVKQLNLGWKDPQALEQQLKDLQNLRNSLAHAKEYAASPTQAKHVCEVVRGLLELRREIHPFLKSPSASSCCRRRPEHCNVPWHTPMPKTLRHCRNCRSAQQRDRRRTSCRLRRVLVR